MNSQRRIAVICLLGLCSSTWGVPEFQAWSQQNSGSNVNCGMCHSHPDGPDGVKAGQIGSLDQVQLQALAEARLAFEPGSEARSPLLNEFGNDIVHQLGRKELVSLRLDPGQLAARLDQKKDHDKDGIPDADEFRDGTDPLDAHSGRPMALFLTNLSRYRFHLVMMALATFAGIFGFTNLLKGLHQSAMRAEAKRQPSKRRPRT